MEVTKESNNIVERKYTKLFSAAKYILNLFLAFGGAYFIYSNFLYCSECNEIAVGYFCILSLSGFINLGLPVKKIDL